MVNEKPQTSMNQAYLLTKVDRSPVKYLICQTTPQYFEFQGIHELIQWQRMKKEQSIHQKINISFNFSKNYVVFTCPSTSIADCFTIFHSIQTLPVLTVSPSSSNISELNSLTWFDLLDTVQNRITPSLQAVAKQ